MSNVKTVVISTVLGAIAGGIVACGVCCMKNESIAIVNVRDVVASSAEVQALQAEQRAKIEGLTAFVQDAQAKLEKEKNKTKKEELEAKYNEELNTQRAAFEQEYVAKLTAVSNELNTRVTEAAKQKGYDILLSKDVVVSGGNDITAEMVEAIK